MRLSTVAAPEQKIVRTIAFNSQTSRNVILAVTLEYVPPDTLKEKQEQEQLKVVAQRKLIPIQDQAEFQRAVERIFIGILASAIQKIELPGGAPVTLNEMRSLFSLGIDQVKKMGGITSPVAFDPKDETPITEEERKNGGYEQAVKTKGDVAKDNILYLLRVCLPFRNFVAGIIDDISYFQDEKWEEQLKNS